MYLLPEQHQFTRVFCAYCGDEHIIIKSCGLRFCPSCGHITRWRVRERLHQIFKLMKYQKGYMLKMLTLSRRNCPDLKEGIDELYTSFRRLRQSKLWNKHVLGGLFVCEITGQQNQWHPHLHCFIYSLRVEWTALRDQWNKASRGGTAVWIANVSHSDAIYYVTKYITKPGTDPEYAYTIDTAMKGRRLFQRFGTFIRLKLPKRLTAKPCPKCGNCDWLTEWDFKRIHMPLPTPTYNNPGYS